MNADAHFLLHWMVRRDDFHGDFLISAGRGGGVTQTSDSKATSEKGGAVST